MFHPHWPVRAKWIHSKTIRTRNSTSPKTIQTVCRLGFWFFSDDFVGRNPCKTSVLFLCLRWKIRTVNYFIFFLNLWFIVGKIRWTNLKGFRQFLTVARPDGFFSRHPGKIWFHLKFFNLKGKIRYGKYVFRMRARQFFPVNPTRQLWWKIFEFSKTYSKSTSKIIYLRKCLTHFQVNVIIKL